MYLNLSLTFTSQLNFTFMKGVDCKFRSSKRTDFMHINYGKYQVHPHVILKNFAKIKLNPLKTIPL